MRSRVDSLWDANAEKYRVVCRSVHVTRATLCIGYSQLAIITVFFLCVLYMYGQSLHGQMPTDHWLAVGSGRYLSSFVSAITLQLVLVCMLIYGVRTCRRCYLLPFIVFATLAVFLAFAQIFYDVAYQSEMGLQLASHVIGMLVHLWCVMVVWRCYCYFGDKKVAEHIGAQLHATSLAFSFDYSQPPPYLETEKRPLALS